MDMKFDLSPHGYGIDRSLRIRRCGEYLDLRGRQLHNNKPHSLYLSPIAKWEIRLAGYVANRDEIINKYKSLIGKPERKRLIERPS